MQNIIGMEWNGMKWNSFEMVKSAKMAEFNYETKVTRFVGGWRENLTCRHNL